MSQELQPENMLESQELSPVRWDLGMSKHVGGILSVSCRADDRILLLNQEFKTKL